ncbi:hypothetical protein L3X38_001747 [Prunus dulcis]|uniref:Uncharacterized protein n=1 Tax=Prunus dulcis TaxID=3755 RepID=A0AAD4WSL3_PRUDU|nr:hypothetical protein L3X38_001747 [Prunus dulcis]
MAQEMSPQKKEAQNQQKPRIKIMAQKRKSKQTMIGKQSTQTMFSFGATSMLSIASLQTLKTSSMKGRKSGPKNAFLELD